MAESPDQLLDLLPLDMLLALQEALADPTADGQERARLRARDAGFYIHCTMRPDGDETVHCPLPMPSGDDEEEPTERLVFGVPAA